MKTDLSTLFALAMFTVSATAPLCPARGQDAIPWSESLGSNSALQSIHTVATEAQVTVSDGTSFAAFSLYHDPQRAAFRQRHADRTVTMGIDGRYIWTSDGQTEAEASPFVERFVLGHQVHAQILYFPRLHGGMQAPVPARFAGQGCLAVSSADDQTAWTLYYVDHGRPLGMVIDREPEPDITLTLGNWRNVDGVVLPHEVVIDDGERTFRYDYSRITLNTGSLDDFRAPFAVLTDEQMLLRLHRVVMDDHFFGRREGLAATRADSVVIVSNGEIQVLDGPEFDTTMERIVTSRDYTVYDDLVRPRVELSEDRSLGQVIAQIHARGVRLAADGEAGEPFRFTCAWLASYRKIDGVWRLTGNISNFKSTATE